MAKQTKKTNRKKSSRRGIPTPVLALVLGFAGLLAISLGLASQISTSKPDAKAYGNTSQSGNAGFLSYSVPKSINIPRLGVDSNLITVGKKSDGTIEVPSGDNYDKPAWYRYSPSPGQNGTAIIEGHVDSYKTGPSVFFELNKMKPGDKFTINRTDAKSLEFKVIAVREYKKNEFPTSKIYGTDDGVRLNLITCGGYFNRQTGKYESNIVVFSVLDKVIHP